MRKKNFAWVGAMVFLLFLIGCIPKNEWVERESGNPVQKHWIPICSVCKEVVNFRSLQCKNPDCRTFLRWEDKTLVAPVLYGEASLAQEPDSKNEKIETPSQPDKSSPHKNNVPGSEKKDSPQNLKLNLPQTGEESFEKDKKSSPVSREGKSYQKKEEKGSEFILREDGEEGFSKKSSKSQEKESDETNESQGKESGESDESQSKELDETDESEEGFSQ